MIVSGPWGSGIGETAGGKAGKSLRQHFLCFEKYEFKTVHFLFLKLNIIIYIQIE
ncbi:hypothetical protein bcf_27825 (plasmid) [Bacillus cereus F837/76]|nr:hypothetical protein bcf_27825 [Bacillus cereus F837/76]